MEELAAGIARVAATEMAQAARVVTVERGVDPRELALVSFGGAGGLHAAGIADELGMSTVIAPVVGGVLSALGLAVSERRRDLVESVLLSGDELTAEAVAEVVGRLAERGRDELGAPEAEVRPTYELRYGGQAFELPVEAGPEPDPGELREGFDAAHEERYGYRDPDAQLELVTVRVAVALPGSELEPATAGEAERRGSRSARFGDEVLDAAVLGPGTRRGRGAGGVRAAGIDAGGAAGLVGHRRRRSGGDVPHEPRRDRAPGDAGRPARRLRRDGRGAGALGPLGQHQGAPRRLDRAVRRRRGGWSCRPSTSPCTWAPCPAPWPR